MSIIRGSSVDNVTMLCAFTFAEVCMVALQETELSENFDDLMLWHIL